MIAVDLGCYNWGRSDSITWILERLQPRILFGFDPCLEQESTEVRDGVAIILSRRAAWTYDGELQVVPGGEGTKVVEGSGSLCFNFGSFLQALPGPVTVKMDIEGAEYPILRDVIDRGLTGRVNEWWIEWHGAPMTNIPHRTWDL